jgi:uncharacterized protein YukE
MTDHLPEPDDPETGVVTREPVPTEAVHVPNPEDTSALTKPFEEKLEELDHERGSNLGQTFKTAVKMHNNNAMLRANMDQLQVMLQDNLDLWAEARKTQGAIMAKLAPTKAEYGKAMEKYITLAERTNKMVLDTAKAMKDIKKEVRQGELASKMFYHVSIIMQFVGGVQAILYSNLRAHPKVLERVRKELRDLSKMFQHLEGS